MPCVLLAPASVQVLKSDMDASTLATAVATDTSSTSAEPVKEDTSSTTSLPTTVASEQSSTTELIPTTTQRRLISYDQRQDGKYNVRADLENFVILVVPPNPSSALNILDLLTGKSTSGNKKKKGHYKHASKKHSIVAESPRNNHHHIQQQVQQQQALQNYQVKSYIPDQFIEGRTPYRVDISSIESAAVPETNVAAQQRFAFPGSASSGKNLIRFEVEPETSPYASVYPAQGKTTNFSYNFFGGGVVYF